MKLEQTRGVIETTRCGLLGGPVDTYRTFIPGPVRYYADDVEVTKERFDSGPPKVGYEPFRPEVETCVSHSPYLQVDVNNA